MQRQACCAGQSGVDDVMTIDTCPGCGYPKFGPDLCDYCRPVLALDQEPRIALTSLNGDMTAAV